MGGCRGTARPHVVIGLRRSAEWMCFARAVGQRERGEGRATWRARWRSRVSASRAASRWVSAAVGVRHPLTSSGGGRGGRSRGTCIVGRLNEPLGGGQQGLLAGPDRALWARAGVQLAASCLSRATGGGDGSALIKATGLALPGKLCRVVRCIRRWEGGRSISGVRIEPIFVSCP